MCLCDIIILIIMLNTVSFTTYLHNLCLKDHFWFDDVWFTITAKYCENRNKCFQVLIQWFLLHLLWGNAEYSLMQCSIIIVNLLKDCTYKNKINHIEYHPKIRHHLQFQNTHHHSFKYCWKKFFKSSVSFRGFIDIAVLVHHAAIIKTSSNSTVYISTNMAYRSMFVCLVFFSVVSLKICSLSLRCQHYRRRTSSFQYSALITIKQWGFVTFHGYYYTCGPTFYNGHLRGPVTLALVVECLAAELSLPV